MSRAALLPLLVLLACASAPEATSGAGLGLPVSFRENVTSVDVLDRALPNVVLIIVDRPDGAIGYGSGLIVDHHGRVITNHHVIAGAVSIKAMLYRKDRLSYTPMDGGLGRYLFENQKELVKATALRVDATSDLALIELNADTSQVNLLEHSSRPLKPGEPVLALGHPHETVWSFTAGVISALHHGSIQHDAAVNRGNSGGPLLTARGEVVGINTAKVLGNADGMAFARPLELALNLLQDAPVARGLDLSTPERAVLSCIRAQELGSHELTGCFDWETRWTSLQQAIEREAGKGRLTPEGRKRIEARLAKLGGKEGWIEDRKASLRIFARGGKEWDSPVQVEDERKAGMAGERARPASAADLSATSGKAKSPTQHSTAHLDRVLQQNGLKVDMNDAQAIQQVLRMGIRVEEVRRVREDLAWVLITGRNTDGSEYRFSECWQLHGETWLQHTPPTPGDMALLPASFSPPLDNLESWGANMVQKLQQDSKTQPPPAPAAKCRDLAHCR